MSSTIAIERGGISLAELLDGSLILMIFTDLSKGGPFSIVGYLGLNLAIFWDLYLIYCLILCD